MVRSRSGVLAASLSWALGGILGCGDSGASVNPRAQDQAQEQNVDEGPGLPAWGRQVPATVPEQELAWALAAELERAPLNARLQELLESERAGAGRARALWSLARIGGPVARDRLLAELDREAPLALAASALLEVP
ncbi:MAG: hypothetical protein KC431_24330, partial [Myxococcales bacterium]|nr:hypothetical protein [Myxococcales bacterium]